MKARASVTMEGRQAAGIPALREGGQRWERQRRHLEHELEWRVRLESAEKKLLQEQVWQREGSIPALPTPE